MSLAQTTLRAQDPPPDLQKESLGNVFTQIASSEYELSWHDEFGYTAPNRKHNLRFAFGESGFSVATRDPENAAHAWGATILLQGFGRNGAAASHMRDAAWNAQGKALSVRGANITVDYQNDEAGLQQDFSISVRPPGNGVLRLNFSVEAQNAAIHVAPDGTALEFVDPLSSDFLARYDSLLVFDRNGRQLPAHISTIDDSHFAIVVDDSNAEYPILIDPILTGDGYYSTPTAGISFGYSVAYFGDRTGGSSLTGVLIGAPDFDNGTALNCGKAYYYKMAGGSLPASPTWTYTGNQTNEHLGWSLCGAGVGAWGGLSQYGFSSICVGAWGYSSSGHVQNGAVFVFDPDLGGTISTSVSATLLGAADGDNFGWCVARVGDVTGVNRECLAVGAVGAGVGQPGQVKVFVGTSSGINTTAFWSALGNAQYEGFGYSIASGDVNGDTYLDLVVGAPNTSGGTTSAGHVYIYHGDGSTFSSSVNTTLNGEASYNEFGYAVDCHDQNGDSYDDVLVGAPNASTSGKGKAYLYRGSSSGVATTATWTGTGGQNGEAFGTSVVFSDTRNDAYFDMVVGSPYYDYFDGSTTWTDAGKATVYWTSTTTGHAAADSSTLVLPISGANNLNTGFSLAYGDRMVSGHRDLVVTAPGGGTSYEDVQFWK